MVPLNMNMFITIYIIQSMRKELKQFISIRIYLIRRCDTNKLMKLVYTVSFEHTAERELDQILLKMFKCYKEKLCETEFH